MKGEQGELIAKVKFWFGAEHPIFNTGKYIVEVDKDSLFAYIYERL